MRASVVFGDARGDVGAMDRRVGRATAETDELLLVSGGKASVFLHQARVVCRRAERRCVPLVRAGAVPDVVRVYLNRLSDYMFTAARFAAMRAGREEESYKKA